MTDEVIVTAARATDFAESCSLLVASGLPVDDLTTAHLDDFLVAKRAAKTVGLIGLERFAAVGLLRSLVIDSSCRGIGLGRQLVSALETRAAEHNIAELWLLTTDADPFFTALGYQVADRDEAPDDIAGTAEFAGLCPGDAVLMRKPLAPAGR